MYMIYVSCSFKFFMYLSPFSRHYPTWSIAKHGPSKCLVEKLPKFMEKFQVSAYISGHDHNLQLIKKNGLLFATSGAGAYVDKSTRNMDKVGRDNVKRVAELQGRSLEKKSCVIVMFK